MNLLLSRVNCHNLEEHFPEEVEDLHPADEREAGEEPHGASNI